MNIITILLLLLTNQAFTEEETIDKETIMFACDIWRGNSESELQQFTDDKIVRH